MSHGPVLQLLRGPGLPARIIALPHESAGVVVGRAIDCDVVLFESSLRYRHAIFTQQDGPWAVVAVGGAALFVNGVARSRCVLGDGDVIALAPGVVELSFHAEAPALRHVSLSEDAHWVRFSPWREQPLMSYAVRVDDESPTLCTAVTRAAGSPGTRPAGRALLGEDAFQLVFDDVAGVSLADVVARTRAQPGARLDPRIAIACAAACVAAVDVTEGAEARLMRGALLTWRGEIVWLHRAPSQRFAWLRHLAEDVLDVSGCAPPTVHDVDAPARATLEHQREQLDELSVDTDTHAALRAIASAAIGPVDAMRAALARAEAMLGPVTREELSALLAQLFAHERALDERVREEVGVVGVAALVQRAWASRR